MVDHKVNQVPIISDEQYQGMLKHFKHGSSINVEPIVNMAGKKERNGSWIVDTGATNHMTSDQNLFKSKVICNNECPFTIPNGDLVPL